MRRISLWLFVLLQALSLSCTEARDDTATGRGARGETSGLGEHIEPPNAVDHIVNNLKRVYPPLQHRRRKQPGLIGTALSYALKAVPSFRISAPPPPAEHSKHTSTITGPLLEGVTALEHLVQQNSSDALFVLAQMNFYGNFTHPKNFHAAFDYYHQLANLDGNSSAQHMLGFMYSTGIGGAVERDQARALLYYTFAALQGHTRAEMTVAHRHHAGIGTTKGCEGAVKYYKRVADKAVAWYRSGPPGGMSWVHEAYRIADETGGVYGEGASVASAGINAKQTHPNSGAYASIDDIIEYWDLISQKGDFKAAFNLGRVYYDGQRGLEADYDLAKKYFYMVTSKYWKKGRVVDTYKHGLDKMAGKAAGYLGRMHLRGDGVPIDFDRAKFWFDRGIQSGDAQSQYGLGLMLLHGYGMGQNVGRAAELFKVAADQDYAPAQVQIGALYLDQGHADDLGNANHYFELAARYGNLEAFYYLAEMSWTGVGREKSCTQAASFYKSVAEKAEPLVSSWAEANLAYEDGDTELAFLEYLGMAEQGYEKAQNNVAYMLDPDQSALPLPTWLTNGKEKPALLQSPDLALIYWTRSSKQGNIDSLVKVGDYYLSGIGTSADVDKAVSCYAGAAEYQQSAQALYNLGWMHENGVGLNQDFHLAKRYYDSALETNEEAYLPVTLSLLKLRVRSAWNTFTHGRVNSIRDEPAPKKDWSLSEWIANFIDDEMRYYEQLYDEDYDDAGMMPGGDGDITGGIAGDGVDDDGIFESLVIVGLAAALVFLLLYRQQRQAQARREEEQARQPAVVGVNAGAVQQQQQQQQVMGQQDGQPGRVQGQQQQGNGNGNGLQGWEWVAGPGGVGH
ncbi:ubiquitin-protein ligase sel1 [Coniochaeta sp. 2T2.1]|nr:ubiquitin-protein ligase sel1 [Coniochaeta sp. 2T2.1]